MDFDGFRLGRDAREELLATQDECTVAWVNDDGFPVAVVQSYVWANGSVWVTAFRDKPRVAALQARPEAAVTVSSKGTDLGAERMAGMRATATVHDDEATKAWFYPAFAAKTAGGIPPEVFAKALTRQDRVVIELRPVRWTTFDGNRLREAAAPKR